MRFTGVASLVLALALSTVNPVRAADLRGTLPEARMLQLLNADRARHGLRPLSCDPALAAAARAHSVDMVQSGFFSHNSPNTGSAEQRLGRAGIPWRAYAENISDNSSVETAQASLMQSPGHRANILNPSYDTVGIGIVPGSRNLCITQMFIKAGRGSSRSRVTAPVEPVPTYYQPAPSPQPSRSRRTRRFRIPGF